MSACSLHLFSLSALTGVLFFNPHAVTSGPAPGDYIIYLLSPLKISVSTMTLFEEPFSVPRGRGEHRIVNVLNKTGVKIIKDSYFSSPLFMLISVDSLLFYSEK